MPKVVSKNTNLKVLFLFIYIFIHLFIMVVVITKILLIRRLSRIDFGRSYGFYGQDGQSIFGKSPLGFDYNVS